MSVEVPVELRSERIVMTVDLLIERVETRLPGRGLGHVIHELRAAAGRAVGETALLAKPNVTLRVLIGVMLVVMVAVLVKIAASYLHFREDVDAWTILEGIDAAISTIVYLGLVTLFLITVEGRLKRRRALKALQELRVLAHVIDMHQLSKDPERLIFNELVTLDGEMPVVDRLTPFQMARYLDYCSEALSLLGKVAVLYVQDLQDEVVLRAVDELERLTTGLSRKIWQKIMILDQIIAAEGLEPQAKRIVKPG